MSSATSSADAIVRFPLRCTSYLSPLHTLYCPVCKKVTLNSWYSQDRSQTNEGGTTAVACAQSGYMSTPLPILPTASAINRCGSGRWRGDGATLLPALPAPADSA